MTLCFVWRTTDSICFASDSRLSFGNSKCDAGIKVSRLPFTIFDAAEPEAAPNTQISGDLGLVFSGSSTAALMTKEALAEIVRDLQGVPQFQSVDMDGISDVVFSGFKVITQAIGTAIFHNAATSILVAGYCPTKSRHRAFQMDMDAQAQHSMREVLCNVGDFEILGSGAVAAKAHLPNEPVMENFISALKAVINDPQIDDVGGNIQFGSFQGTAFKPYGVAETGNSERGIHYWRGPLDLNGSDFDQASGLISRFPYLDCV